MTASILACYLSATPADIDAGLGWYEDAWAVAADLTPDDPRRGAAILAVLSPRCPWVRNVDAARAVVAGLPTRGILGANVCKAIAIRDGGPIGAYLGGSKVTAFYLAITGDRDAVVVDTWAARVAGRPAPGTVRQYARIARAYQRAARRIGITPRDLQAVTWVVARGGAA